MITIPGWDAHFISLSPCPRHIQAWPSLSNRVKLESSLRAVPLVHEIPSLCSLSHLTASLVNQSPFRAHGRTPRLMASSQKLVYNALNWQPPPKSAGHIYVHTRSWDETIVPDSNQLYVDQCLGCVAKFWWRIINTHLIFLPLLPENCPQPTILQFAPVFAPANFIAWWPQGMIEIARHTRSIAVLASPN